MDLPSFRKRHRHRQAKRRPQLSNDELAMTRPPRPREVLQPPEENILTKFGVEVRRRGAEMQLSGTIFDFRQNDVNDLYRSGKLAKVLNNRCLRCSTDMVLGQRKSNGRIPIERTSREDCDECCRLQHENEERQQLAAAQREEENRKFDYEIAQRRAKEKREGFASMFKPKYNSLRSRSLNSLVEDDISDEDDDDDDDDDGDNNMDGFDEITAKEHEILLPPPTQLDALLPVPMSSKQEFLRTLKAYKKSQAALELVRAQHKKHVRARAEQRRRLLEDENLRARHEILIRNALEKMQIRTTSSTFTEWREFAQLQKKRRMLACFSSTYLVQATFEKWHLWLVNWKVDRLAGAIVLQSAWRRALAQKFTAGLRRKNKAVHTIQGFGRTILAKKVLILARRKIVKQEKLIRRMLFKLSSNLSLRVFVEWKRYYNLMKRVRNMAFRANGHQLKDCWENWSRNVAILRRERHRQAIANIQRVGRGFVGRLCARQKRIERNAAIVIQQMCRARLARNILRTKLRQRRVIKRKLGKIFAERKSSRFASWKTYVVQRKTLRRMISGSDARTLEGAFARWSSRHRASWDIQRVYRGYKGRREFRRRQQEYLRDMAEGGCRTLGERQRMKLLYDERYESELLLELREKLLRVKRLALVFERKKKAETILDAYHAKHDKKVRLPLWQLMHGHTKSLEEEEAEDLLAGFTQEELEHDGVLVMWIHGTAQRFHIEQHATYLEEMLMRDIQKELSRLQRARDQSDETLRREEAEWKETLERYLHRKMHLVDMSNVQIYYNAGKSFTLSFSTAEQVQETVLSWLDMLKKDFISRWTFLAWVAHGMILRKGIRAKERLMIWGVLMEELEQSLVDELAALMLQIIQDQSKAR